MVRDVGLGMYGEGFEGADEGAGDVETGVE